MIIQRYYEDPQTLHIGCEPIRCHYIPQGLKGNKAQKLLSGNDWHFRYYKSIEEADEFYRTGYQSDASFSFTVYC